MSGQSVSSYDPSRPPKTPPCCSKRCTCTGEDFGAEPYVVDIDKATLENRFYRRALWTGEHLQLTLMCIPPDGDTGVDIHPDADQFMRIEQGQGKILMGKTEHCLKYQRDVSDSSAILIPAGTWHSLVNTGSEPLKLYSIYSDTVHPAGIIHCTKADSDEDE